MAYFTYELQHGVFVTTDIEPPVWTERFPLTDEQEALIRSGANLETEDGVMLIEPSGTDEVIVVDHEA